MKTEYDVVIVGGGGSGLAAAVSSAEQNLEVLVLEKQRILGGTTSIAVGSITANRTSLQRTRGIDDSLEAHLEDIAKFAPPEIEARNNAPLRRFFLAQTADTYEWLQDMGLVFHGPSPEPPNRVPRMHNVVPNAKAYVGTLQNRLLRLGGTILTSAEVKRLLRNGDRVEGVEATLQGATFRFKGRRGVVLAAGDYTNSKALIAAHKGSEYGSIDGINPNALGDGHRLVQAMGGELLNMDVTWGPEIRFVPPEKRPFVQLLPTGGWPAKVVGRLLPMVPQALIHRLIKGLLVTWQHPEDGIYDRGAVLVNATGDRFCNERKSPERELALARQPGGVAYILLDERLARLYSAWPNFISTAPEIAHAYVEDYLRLRPDVSAAGRTLEEIALARHMLPEVLSSTVEKFNGYVETGGGDVYGRSGDTHPLRGGRWILLGPAKAYFTITEGGASVDQDLNVLEASGKPIPGLYAVGCNGLGGQILFSHGLHIGWAMTSGRLVGKVLARVE